METKKLYYDDVYCRAFTARVTGCVQEKKTWLVTLDQTAFYPEGGGQPADRGTLGRAKVLDVQERAGEIVHTCDRALPVGEEVAGELDWARRFDHMQASTSSPVCCARRSTATTWAFTWARASSPLTITPR